MTGTNHRQNHAVARRILAVLAGLLMVLGLALPAAAQSGERALYLYYTHTKETARIVFKRNGQYVQSGLSQLNQFLRDWRRNEPATMDPALFDLLWEIYEEVGATQPIHIVSAYRSPATNAMLAANSSGVADDSLHMRGKAVDIYIPGIPLARLRAVAMRKQVGGVGYYPTSGSPFVHVDTGNVRAWPRMTTAQLRELFPDGRTLHLPLDGKPLSQEGYRLAQADWQACRSVPCPAAGTAVASAGGSGRTLMDLFFGSSDPAPSQTTSQPAPQTAVRAAAAAAPAAPRVAPVPAIRTAALPTPAAPADIPFSRTGSAPLEPEPARIAPVPAQMSPALLARMAEQPATQTAVMAIAALDAPIPAPRLHMTNPPPTPGDILVSAYAAADAAAQAPGAQRALEILVARETTATPAPPAPALTEPAAPQLRPPVLAAMPSPAPGLIASLFEATFGAVENPPAPAATTPALATRPAQFIAPDLDHVAQTLLAPEPLSSARFAMIVEHDLADFDPATVLGPAVARMGVGDEPAGWDPERFSPARTLLVAAR